MVATELRTRKTLRVAQPFPKLPPFNQGSDDLVVAYFASAELASYLALGWPFPINVVDLYAEFRLLLSGLSAPHGFNLQGALAFFGIPGIESVEKVSMRELAMRGGPFTNS